MDILWLVLSIYVVYKFYKYDKKLDEIRKDKEND